MSKLKPEDFKFWFEDLPNRGRGIVRRKTLADDWWSLSRLGKSLLLQAFWWLYWLFIPLLALWWLRRAVNSLNRWRKKPRHHLEIKIKLTWTKVLILCVLGFVFWPNTGNVIAIPEPPKIQKVADSKPIEPTKLKPVAPVAPKVVPKPQPTVKIIPNCGDNQYAQYIYRHESGCNLYARNAGGCLGIGQACPGSKLTAVCDLASYSCQNSFFTSYVNSRYGGWYEAYLYWLKSHWY